MIRELIEFYKSENFETKYYKSVQKYIFMYFVIYLFASKIFTVFNINILMQMIILGFSTIIYGYLVAADSIIKNIRNCNNNKYNILNLLFYKKEISKLILNYNINIISAKIKNMGINNKEQIKEILEYLRSTKTRKSILEIILNVVLYFLLPISISFTPQIISNTKNFIEYVTLNAIYVFVCVAIIYIPIMIKDFFLIMFGLYNKTVYCKESLELILTELLIKHKK